MYSSEATGAMKTYFAVRTDGTADGAWAIEEVPTGYDSDDHINLKADAAGRVYAVVKTSNTSGSAPLVILMVRGTDGTWTSHVVGTYSNSHTRPIVELDEGAGRIDVFATHGQSGGTIVRKSARIGAPDFAAGTGEIVMQDDDAPKLNDATSTKQNVSAASGLVVLANNNTTSRYWHAEIAGDGSIPAPAAPTPGLHGHADRRRGAAHRRLPRRVDRLALHLVLVVRRRRHGERRQPVAHLHGAGHATPSP